MKAIKNVTKFGVCGIVLILLFTLIFTFSLNLQEPASAWGPPGTYSNESYNVSQSEMVTRSAYSSYTAPTSGDTGLSYGYSHQKDHSRSKWHTQSTSTQYANYVMTIKLSDHIFNALRRGKVTLKVTVSCQFKTDNKVASAYFYMKPFIAIGTISGTGLARDSFTNTNTNTGSEQYKKLKNSSSNVSGSTSSSGSSSSGQYVRFGGTFKTKSDKSLGSTAKAQINSISMKLEISHSGDTTNPSISGTHNAFTTSSSVTLSDTGSALRRYRINSGTWQNIASSSGPTTSKSISLSQQTNNIEVEDNVGNTASKTIKYYNLTFRVTRYTNGSSSSSGGSATLDGSSTLSKSGKTVGGSYSLGASANSGYYFVSWQKVNGAGTGHTYGQKNITYQIVEDDAYTTTLDYRAHFKSITTSDRTVTYDGNRHGVSFSPDAGFSVSYQYTNKSGTPSYSSSTAPYEAGSYDARITVSRGSQEMGTKTVTLTINKKSITITPNSGQSKIYGENDPIFTYQITSGSLVSGDTLNGILSRQIGENAGTYNITQGNLTSATNRNYNISFVTTRTFAINKKAVTITAQNKTITYGDSAPSFTFSYSGLLSGDSLSDTASTNYNRYDDVGNYQINITIKTYTNYNPTYINGTLTVTKKPITVKADNKQITYGEDVPEFSFSYIGLVNGDTLSDSAVISYNRYDDAGDYDIEIVPKTYTNYTASYENGTLTVNKKAITVVAENKRITYGDEVPQLTASHIGLINDDTIVTELTVGYSRYDDAGTYTIEIITPYDNYTNYYASEQFTGTLRVDKKTVTITPNDYIIIFGDSLPLPGEYSFSYDGLINNDTLEDSAYTDYVFLDNAGDYTIYVQDTEHTNYQLDKKTATLYVAKKGIVVKADDVDVVYGEEPVYTFSYDGLIAGDPNLPLTGTTGSSGYYMYAGAGETFVINADEEVTYANYFASSYESGTLTVKRRDITITAEDKEMTYGDDLPDFTFVYTNVVNDDELDFIESIVIDGYDMNAGRVDEYEIVITSGITSHANYTFTARNSGTLTVNKRALYITPRNREIVFGQSAPTSFQYDIEGLVGFDGVGQITAYADYTRYQPAGEYDIIVNPISHNDYYGVYIEGVLKVNKQLITVTAENKDTIYNQASPEFTFTYTGLVAEDPLLESEKGKTTASTVYTVGDDAGNYEITIGRDVEYINYEVVGYNDGTLYVDKAEAIITTDAQQTHIYDGSIKEVVASLNHSEAVLEYHEQKGYTQSGTYQIEVTSQETTNYYQTSEMVTLVIEKREITVMAKAMAKIYGEDDETLEYDITEGSLVEGEELWGELARESGEVRGTYAISQGTLTNENNLNYDITFVGNVFTINRRDITVKADDIEIVYGDETPELTVTYYDTVFGDVPDASNEMLFVSYNQFGDVGEYTIYIGTGTTYDNYRGIFENGILTVIPKEITVTADNKTITYGDETPIFTFTFTGLENNDTVPVTASSPYQQFDNVATYAIEIDQSVSGDSAYDNYTPTFENGIITVEKKALTITADDKEITYGDDIPEFTFSYIGLVNGDTVTDTAITEYEIYMDSGDYAITPNEREYTNYEAAEYIPGTLKVNKKDITVKADDKTIAFDEDWPEFTFTYTGLVNNDTLIDTATADYSVGDAVGEYTITVTPKTYTNYDATYQTGILTVIPAVAKIDGEEVQTYIYDKTIKNIIMELSHTETTLQYEPQQGYVEAGTYVITVYAIATENYNYVERDITLIIEKRELFVEANEQQKIYGYSDPSLTYDYSNLIVTDQITGGLQREIGEPVGDYEIGLGDIDAGDNYFITYTPNILKIVPRPIEITANAKQKVYGYADPSFDYLITDGELVTGDELYGGLARATGQDAGVYEIGIGDLSNTNYAITYISANLTIDPRPIDIRAIATGKIYGYDDPVIEYEVFGAEQLAYEDVLAGEFARETGEDVGDYDIYQGEIDNIRNPNYDITFEPNFSDFVIEKRAITVSADAIDKIYGELDPELTYQITEGELAFEDELAGELLRESGENVGIYLIMQSSLNNANNTNYDITYISNNFEIEQRTIVIEAHSAEKTYGEADPSVFEYTMIEGNLVYGDGLTGILSREWGEGAGDYKILQNTLTAGDNYNLVYAFAIFTIKPIELVIEAEDSFKIYGYGDPDSYEYEITSENQLLAGDTLSGRVEREVGQDVGEYEIHQGSLGNPNYAIEFISGTFTITPRLISIAAISASKVYGDDDPEIGYSVEAGELAYEDELEGSFGRATGRIVGTYAITQGTINNETNPNYNINFESGAVLTITRRSITVTADDKETHYGNAAPFFTFTYENIVYDDVLIDTASTTYRRYDNVGHYDILVNPRTYQNYVAEYEKGTLTVTKRPITIRPNNMYIEYGDEKPTEFTFSYDGLVNNDELNDTGYTEYEKDDPVDEYSIYVNEKEYANYVGVYESGILYVTRAQSIIWGDIVQEKQYNGEEQTVDAELNHDESPLYYDPSGYINAGEYQIEVSSHQTDNYGAGFAIFTLKILPKPITITAIESGKDYGDDDPELEYTTGGDLIEGDTMSGRLYRAAGDGVGEYAINRGTLTPGPNYDVTYIGAMFTINPRYITIVPADRDKVYGQSDPSLTYTILGDELVEGDMLTGSLEREAGEDVGEYIISLGTLNNSNYDIDIAEVYFTIRARNITIRAASKEKVYGETDPILEYEIVSGSLAFEDTLQGGLVRESGENVGEYDILKGTVDNDNNPNYNIIFASTEQGKFTIQARPLEIEAEEMVKIYKDPDPVLHYNITKGQLVLGDEITGQLERETGSDIGEYEILIGSLTAGDNYDITFITNILHIEPRPITITASTHECEYGKVGGFELTFEIEGNEVPSDRDRIQQAVYLTSNATASSPIGNYIVFINLVESLPNYDITLRNGSLEIIPATIDLDPDRVFPDKRVVYNGDEHIMVINQQYVNVSGYNITYQNNKGIEIGVYEATATISKENFETTVLNARLIIMKNTATTLSGIYQGLITKDDGLDPYAELMITQNTDEYILSLAQADIQSDREEVRSIMNINLFSEGEEISIAGGAEIRLRIPPEVRDVDSLRLVYISDDTMYEVSYTVDGNYIVFEGDDLGSYAFITISEEALRTENLARVLFYALLAVLAVAVIIIISAAVMNKSS